MHIHHSITLDHALAQALDALRAGDEWEATRIMRVTLYSHDVALTEDGNRGAS